MRVIPPLAITDAILTSTTAPELAPAAYNGATTYALNDTVSVAGSAGLRTVYKSLQAANTGNTPASSPAWWANIGTTYQEYSGATTYAALDYAQDSTTHLVYQSAVAGNVGNALTDTTKWVLVGPTNRWKMFDLLRNTATAAVSPLAIVLTPGERVNSLALMGMVADSVTISATSGGVSVFSLTQNLSTRNVVDWYTYFFEPFGNAPNLVTFDIPSYSNIIITVTLTAASGSVSCGGVVVGNNEYIGAVQYNAVSDMLNFSSVTRDSFGNATLVQRRNIPKTSQKLFLDKARVNRVMSVRDSLNALPAVWSGLDDPTDGYFDALFILGYYRGFSINLDYPENAIVNLELEEI